MMKEYELDSFSNFNTKSIIINKNSFENKTVEIIEPKYNDFYESKISRIISKLRRVERKDFFEEGTIDEAICSLSRFVSLMGNLIDNYQDEIQFDTDLSDSIEITFKGHGITRFNLMFAELNTHEEAFLFYMKDGRPTQVNGSLSLMVDLLKQVLR